MAPGTEFPHDFCAGISPLQLGVVLVFFIFKVDVHPHGQVLLHRRLEVISNDFLSQQLVANPKVTPHPIYTLTALLNDSVNGFGLCK